MKVTRMISGAVTITALMTASLLVSLLHKPVLAGACVDFEDWNDDDLWPNPDDPHHKAVGGPHPSQQEPAGEWDWVGEEPNRHGSGHTTLNDNHTADSGEHETGPACPGGGSH